MEYKRILNHRRCKGEQIVGNRTAVHHIICKWWVRTGAQAKYKCVAANIALIVVAVVTNITIAVIMLWIAVVIELNLKVDSGFC